VQGLAKSRSSRPSASGGGGSVVIAGRYIRVHQETAYSREGKRRSTPQERRIGRVIVVVHVPGLAGVPCRVSSRRFAPSAAWLVRPRDGRAHQHRGRRCTVHQGVAPAVSGGGLHDQRPGGPRTNTAGRSQAPCPLFSSAYCPHTMAPLAQVGQEGPWRGPPRGFWRARESGDRSGPQYHRDLRTSSSMKREAPACAPVASEPTTGSFERSPAGAAHCESVSDHPVSDPKTWVQTRQEAWIHCLGGTNLTTT